MSSHDDGSRIRLVCPYCGSVYSYLRMQADREGHYRCQNCNNRIERAGGAGIEIEGERTYRIEPAQSVALTKAVGLRIACPYCGASYVYLDRHRGSDGQFRCQNCDVILPDRGERVVLESKVISTPRGRYTEETVVSRGEDRGPELE